jgi:hypothetical protein
LQKNEAQPVLTSTPRGIYFAFGMGTMAAQ